MMSSQKLIKKMNNSIRVLNKFTIRSCKHFSSRPGRPGSSGLGKGVDLLADVNVDKRRLGIRGYTDKLFMVNETQVNQSVLLFSYHHLLWNAKTVDEITIENLSVFTLIYPTIEILLIGCGHGLTAPFNPSIVKHFRSKGIVIEPTSTISAASSFNILNSEGRNVAAALLTIEPTEPPLPY